MRKFGLNGVSIVNQLIDANEFNTSAILSNAGEVMAACKTDVPAGDIAWKICLRICVWYSQLLGHSAAQTTRDFQTVFGQDAIKPAAI